MYNLRKIDEKFYLSGGWDKPEADIELLKRLNIKGILDVEWAYDDGWESSYIAYVQSVINTHKIDYYSMFMVDGHEEQNLPLLLEHGYEFLKRLEIKYPNIEDKILVKCAAGISRSSTQLINYLCGTKSLSAIQGLEYVRNGEKYQPIQWPATPNSTFFEYLKKKYPSVAPQLVFTT